MLLILAIGLTFISIALLFSQYLIVKSDSQLRRADDAFYTYASIKPYKDSPHVRKFRNYNLINSDNYEMSFDLQGKKASNGVAKGHTCVGLRDYGIKRSKCRDIIRSVVDKNITNDSVRVVGQIDSLPDLEPVPRSTNSIQIDDPLLDLVEKSTDLYEN